jgi:hypothetical protein
MDDTEPQTAAAKVLWHFTMSRDGFVAGPEHDMQWLTGVAVRPGLIEEYTRTTGAVLAGPPRAAQALDREGIAC